MGVLVGVAGCSSGSTPATPTNQKASGSSLPSSGSPSETAKVSPASGGASVGAASMPATHVVPGAAATDYPRILLSQSGAGSATTKEVSTSGPWTFTYSVDCSRVPDLPINTTFDFLQGGQAIDFESAPPTQTSSGVLSKDTAGQISIVVTSHCTWSVKITQTEAAAVAEQSADGNLGSWGYAIILASLPATTEGKVKAVAAATLIRSRAGGTLDDLEVGLSDDAGSNVEPGRWVVFSGFASQAEAIEELAHVRSAAGVPDAYIRCVGGSACVGGE